MAFAILIIIYGVGLVGSLLDIHPMLYSLTPLTLLISTAFVLWHHNGDTSTLTKWMAFVFIVGYLVEVAGVNTGLIFGVYAYGTVLGPKVFATPLMIGVNWMMLTYAIYATTCKLLPGDASTMLKSLVGSLCMVLLDVFIEPVAIGTGMWHWYGQDVPLQNYLAWGVVSFVVLWFLHAKLPKHQQNPIAVLLLILQFLFFGVQVLFKYRF